MYLRTQRFNLRDDLVGIRHLLADGVHHLEVGTIADDGVAQRIVESGHDGHYDNEGHHAYCNPGDGSPNNVATISASGSNLSQTITVDLASGPPNQFTYLLIGNGSAKVSQPPGAKGDLCVIGGNCLGRYVKDIGSVSAGGTFSTDITNSISGGPNFGIPTCGGNIQAGDTWFFQYWHRQPMGQPSTFSEALGVTFQ